MYNTTNSAGSAHGRRAFIFPVVMRRIISYGDLNTGTELNENPGSKVRLKGLTQ